MEIGRFISFAGKLNMACPFVHSGRERLCLSVAAAIQLGNDKSYATPLGEDWQTNSNAMEISDASNEGAFLPGGLSLLRAFWASSCPCSNDWRRSCLRDRGCHLPGSSVGRLSRRIAHSASIAFVSLLHIRCAHYQRFVIFAMGQFSLYCWWAFSTAEQVPPQAELPAAVSWGTERRRNS